jgi:SAM-dependent methyltransferase
MSGLGQTLKQFVSPGGIEGWFALQYASFGRNTPAMREAYRHLAEMVAGELRAGRVLEVGPGPGFVGIEIARLLPEAQVIGVDLSETMVELATANAAECGVAGQVSFRVGDAAHLPFGQGTFDLVVSSGSLHHWRAPERVFAEIHRVLRPGGWALVSDIRRDAPPAEVRAFAAGIGSRFMRWGLRHSFAESYTMAQAAHLAATAPFADVRCLPDGISLALWLDR